MDVTLSPTACRRGITSVQHDPSANSPCTSTTFLAAGTGSAARAWPHRSGAAAPTAAIRPRKIRRSIVEGSYGSMCREGRRMGGVALGPLHTFPHQRNDRTCHFSQADIAIRTLHYRYGLFLSFPPKDNPRL